MKCPICRGETKLVYVSDDGTKFYQCLKGHRKTHKTWRGRRVVKEYPVFMVKLKPSEAREKER